MEYGTISFENAMRMRKRILDVQTVIDTAARRDLHPFDEADLLAESTKQMRSKINELAFNFAQQHGLSIWDVCMTYMPEFADPETEIVLNKTNSPDVDVKIEQSVRLVPMPMELVKGPEYWENKYFRLKDSLRKLIENMERINDEEDNVQ